MAEGRLAKLPAELLEHIVLFIQLAHHIARTAPTCRVISVAVRNAFKVRPFSGKVITLAGHRAGIEAAVAPDGRIITASKSTIRVWHDGTCTKTIEAHRGLGVDAVAVLPGGARFVSCCSQWEEATVWTLDCVPEVSIATGVNVVAVAAMPDGLHFVLGLYQNDEGEVRLYHVDGTLVHAFKGHTNDVFVLAVTPDGQHIISGDVDDVVKVWNVGSKSLVSTLEEVVHVAAMPDSQRFLSGSDETIKMWLLDGTLVNEFELDVVKGVTALVALPDNQHALSGLADGAVKLFNVTDGAILRTFHYLDGHLHKEPVWSLELLPDGVRFVSSSDDKTACIVEHGFVFAPTPVYVAARKEVLKARIEEEEKKLAVARWQTDAEEEIRRCKAELARLP